MSARPGGGAIALKDFLIIETPDTVACCAADADCGDTNPCTLDTCSADHTCAHAPIAGCCLSDADCGDTNVCTLDTCAADHTCVNVANTRAAATGSSRATARA